MNRSPLLVGLLALGLAVSRAGTQEASKDDTFKLSDDEQKVLDLVNKERAKEKLPPLKVDEKLCKAARGHAANMARQGKLEHILDGKRPGQRIEAAGYRFLECGENIFLASKNNPARVVAGWMESRGHRESILSKDFTETGLGIARTAGGDYYFAQVFAIPEKK
jgi:uncharacterized protein YkwD